MPGLKKLVSLVALFTIAILTSGSSCDSSSPSLLSGNGGDFNSGPRTTFDRANGDAERGDPLQRNNCETSCPSGEACVEGACVPAGSLNVVMVWDTPVDLDLHVRTPSGETIFYRNRAGDHGGRFLQDGCIADNCDENTSRIESVMWRDQYPQGTYDVWVVNYDGAASANFQIEIVQNGERKDTFSGSIGASEGERSSTFSVCIGEDSNDDSCSQQQQGCRAELDRLGISYRDWSYSTQTAAGQSCTVNDPIIVDGRINGVDFQHYQQSSPTTMRMSCELAIALHEKAEVLKRNGIRAAGHHGTFNCRTIGDTNRLSNHAFGMAIDIRTYIGNDGTVYNVIRDWEHDTDNPTTAKGQKLYTIAHDLHRNRVFNNILTPDFNTAHDDHFHYDVDGGNGNYLGYVVQNYYIGNDRHDELCGH